MMDGELEDDGEAVAVSGEGELEEGEVLGDNDFGGDLNDETGAKLED